MMTVTYTARTATAVCPFHPMDSMFAFTWVGRQRIAARASNHNELLHPRSSHQLEARSL